MEHYELLEVVGEGTYGVVLKCRHRQSGQIVAVKRFKHSELNEYVRVTMTRELCVERLLRGEPYVVQLLESFMEKKQLYLVMEYIQGNLLNLLDEQPNGLSLEGLRTMAYTLILGVRSCHRNRIIHRDIKPENILMREDGTATLCDFGFSRPITTMAAAPDSGATAEEQRVAKSADVLDNLVRNDHRECMTVYVATRWYRSPEMLLAMERYDYAVDMWAVGAIIAEAADGQPLLPGKSEVEQLALIQSRIGDLPKEWQGLLKRKNRGVLGLPSGRDPSSNPLNSRGNGKKRKTSNANPYIDDRFRKIIGAEGVDLLRKLLALNGSDRLTADEALQHPFFEGVAARFATDTCTTPQSVSTSNAPSPTDESLSISKHMSFCTSVESENLTTSPKSLTPQGAYGTASPTDQNATFSSSCQGAEPGQNALSPDPKSSSVNGSYVSEADAKRKAHQRASLPTVLNGEKAPKSTRRKMTWGVPSGAARKNGTPASQRRSSSTKLSDAVSPTNSEHQNTNENEAEVEDPVKPVRQVKKKKNFIKANASSDAVYRQRHRKEEAKAKQDQQQRAPPKSTGSSATKRATNSSTSNYMTPVSKRVAKPSAKEKPFILKELENLSFVAPPQPVEVLELEEEDSTDAGREPDIPASTTPKKKAPSEGRRIQFASPPPKSVDASVAASTSSSSSSSNLMFSSDSGVPVPFRPTVVPVAVRDGREEDVLPAVESSAMYSDPGHLHLSTEMRTPDRVPNGKPPPLCSPLQVTELEDLGVAGVVEPPVKATSPDRDNMRRPAPHLCRNGAVPIPLAPSSPSSKSSLTIARGRYPSQLSPISSARDELRDGLCGYSPFKQLSNPKQSPESADISVHTSTSGLFAGDIAPRRSNAGLEEAMRNCYARRASSPLSLKDDGRAGMPPTSPPVPSAPASISHRLRSRLQPINSEEPMCHENDKMTSVPLGEGVPTTALGSLVSAADLTRFNQQNGRKKGRLIL